MNNFEQIKEKNNIVPFQSAASQISPSTNDGVTAKEQDASPLEAADLFAHFTANIIKEERLFIR
jgi:hypothetical protein